MQPQCPRGSSGDRETTSSTEARENLNLRTPVPPVAQIKTKQYPNRVPKKPASFRVFGPRRYNHPPGMVPGSAEKQQCPPV
jgi:hypothetical protein